MTLRPMARNDTTSGVAVGDEPETIYMVRGGQGTIMLTPGGPGGPPGPSWPRDGMGCLPTSYWICIGSYESYLPSPRPPPSPSPLHDGELSPQVVAGGHFNDQCCFDYGKAGPGR
jgi:hypothetical protein